MEETFIRLIRPVLPSGLRPRLKAIYHTILKVYFAGDRYLCPICSTQLRKLLPVGYHYPVLVEKQVVGAMPGPSLCPICRSLDRTRLLWLYLKNETDLFQRPQKVLHFAPEYQIEKPGRAVSGDNYLTADLFVSHVMLKMDLMDIQFPENTFDAVICSHVLEHVPDDRKAMHEIFRVLKPGGWAVLQVPVSDVLKETYEDPSITTRAGREKAFGQCDHVRIHGQDYPQRLEQIGFKVEGFHWIESPEKYGTSSNRFGLNKREVVWRVDKPMA